MTSCLLTEVAILMDYHTSGIFPWDEKDDGGGNSELSTTLRSTVPRAHPRPVDSRPDSRGGSLTVQNPMEDPSLLLRHISAIPVYRH